MQRREDRRGRRANGVGSGPGGEEKKGAGVPHTGEVWRGGLASASWNGLQSSAPNTGMGLKGYRRPYSGAYITEGALLEWRQWYRMGDSRRCLFAVEKAPLEDNY